MSKPIAVILAAGKGTRMKSDLPKVLFPVLGRPMVEFVMDAVRTAGIDRILLVVGYRADEVKRQIGETGHLTYVLQEQQLGTGHAVQVCRDQLDGHDGPVLVVTGDSPLLQVSSVKALLDCHAAEGTACVLGTQHRDDPTGLGRIVRDEEGQFVGIVEEKDTTDEQKQITEVNMSTYVFDCRQLLRTLDRLKNDNQQGEYYITDCPGIMLGEGANVRALPVLKPCEALSINTIDQLKVVEDEMRKMGYGS
jgi:bifunctional UDP-N-acetylglucosamine pyrophosphorylase/glucosamine-1-phosphate N-acetyltransferase